MSITDHYTDSSIPINEQITKLSSLLTNVLGSFNLSSPGTRQLNDNIAQTRSAAFSPIPCENDSTHCDSEEKQSCPNEEWLAMKLEDYRSNELRESTKEIYCTGTELLNLSTYLESLVESGQAYGDFPAFNLKFHISDSPTEVDPNMSFSRNASRNVSRQHSFILSDNPRGHGYCDGIAATYNDYSDIIEKVDTEITDKLEEYNQNLESKLKNIAVDLDTRQNRALSSQAINDTILTQTRKVVKLRQNSLNSDMKKFYKDSFCYQKESSDIM